MIHRADARSVLDQFTMCVCVCVCVVLLLLLLLFLLWWGGGGGCVFLLMMIVNVLHVNILTSMIIYHFNKHTYRGNKL